MPEVVETEIERKNEEKREWGRERERRQKVAQIIRWRNKKCRLHCAIAYLLQPKVHTRSATADKLMGYTHKLAEREINNKLFRKSKQFSLSLCMSLSLVFSVALSLSLYGSWFVSMPTLACVASECCVYVCGAVACVLIRIGNLEYKSIAYTLSMLHYDLANNRVSLIARVKMRPTHRAQA